MTIKFIHRCNHPAIINIWLKNGYGVEVDLRLRDGKLYSGHDEPCWLFPFKELFHFGNQDKFLFHAKDLETYEYLVNQNTEGSNLHFFFQDKDDISRSSWGMFVLHSNVRLNRDYKHDEIAILPKGSLGDAWGVVLDVLDEKINEAAVAA